MSNQQGELFGARYLLEIHRPFEDGRVGSRFEQIRFVAHSAWEVLERVAAAYHDATIHDGTQWVFPTLGACLNSDTLRHFPVSVAEIRALAREPTPMPIAAD